MGDYDKIETYAVVDKGLKTFKKIKLVYITREA
jgi:hypothetical protein